MKNINNERVVTYPKHEVTTWIRRGNEAMFDGDYNAALQHFDKALQHQADSEIALHAKANVLEAMGRYDEAVKYYDRALECDPGDAECWFNKGITLKKLGRDNDGAKCIENGVHLAMGSG